MAFEIIIKSFCLQKSSVHKPDSKSVKIFVDEGGATVIVNKTDLCSHVGKILSINQNAAAPLVAKIVTRPI